eukprot:TRINITY_DN32099_c0_g1_i1.p1 TRINITY_DN32099_c0_g1~~TRINITY_DN32099_c0_g1_i1.p1  ORF type:complete len:437 (+),score=53.66 TRINITY_DN32099_c0_g1_i1:49-1311(+)
MDMSSSGAAAPATTYTDPLLLLRDELIAKRKIPYADGFLELGGRRLHKSTKCGYRLSSPKGPLIDIGSVWYMVHEVSQGKSYSKARTESRGFQYVGVTTRGDFLEYLTGVTNSCPGLVPEVLSGSKRPRPEADSLEEVAGVPPTKRRGVGEVAKSDPFEITQKDVAARVRPLRDLDVLVRCVGRQVPNVDAILKIAQEESRIWGSGDKHTPRRLEPAGHGKVPLSVELEQMLKEDATALPIILIPCNKNAPVNMLNVHDFLQNGIYNKPSEEHLRFFESTRPESVQVCRNIGGKLWTFEIRDSAAKFSKHEWLRTVCVVSDGVDWQFKGWPFESTVDIFTTLCGVFFQACGAPVPVHVNQWQVKIIPFTATHLGHRFSVHRDAFFTVIGEFFDSFRSRRFKNHVQFDPEKRIIERVLPVL